MIVHADQVDSIALMRTAPKRRQPDLDCRRCSAAIAQQWAGFAKVLR
jgi:hypothetical protein